MAYDVNFVALSGSDWAQNVEAVDDRTNLPLDLANMLIELNVRDKCNATLLQASSADGSITKPELGQFQWVFSKDSLRSLCPGTTYDVGCRFTLDGKTTALFTGRLAILDGEF